MDSTTPGANSVRHTLNAHRLWGTIALTWSIASPVVADTLRWGGMVDPPQLDAAFVVFSIDTDLQKATIASLPWNLPATKGTIDEYPRIETTFDPAAMVIITDWIRAKTGLVQ